MSTPAMPAGAVALDALTCANCGALGADSSCRGLCGRCYTNAAVRTCFASDGRRVADPPRSAEPEEPELPTPRSPVPAVAAPDPAECDRALLAAVVAIVGTGSYIDADGKPAAGQRAAFRDARLGDAYGGQAIGRLVKAGDLEPVRVWGTTPRAGRKEMAGLRLPGRKRSARHGRDLEV